jgi:hypothetical protein
VNEVSSQSNSLKILKPWKRGQKKAAMDLVDASMADLHTNLKHMSDNMPLLILR